MKKRVFTLMNFLALNVLFFAIYLNFIHKEANTLPAVTASGKEAVKSIAASPANNALVANIQGVKNKRP